MRSSTSSRDDSIRLRLPGEDGLPVAMPIADSRYETANARPESMGSGLDAFPYPGEKLEKLSSEVICLCTSPKLPPPTAPIDCCGVMDFSNSTTFDGYNGCTSGSSSGLILFHSFSFCGCIIVKTLRPNEGSRTIKSRVALDRSTIRRYRSSLLDHNSPRWVAM